MKSYAALLLPLMLCASCSKQEKPADPLVGNWTLIQSGFDKNYNGTLDSDEILIPAESTDYSIYQFKSNGYLDITTSYKGEKQTRTNWEWVINDRRDSLAICTDFEFAGTRWVSFRVQSYEPSRLFLVGHRYNELISFRRNVP